MLKHLVCLFAAVPLLLAAGDSSGEKAVLAAMDAWTKATMQQDRAALDKLLHADLTYTHSNAKVQTKAEVIESAMTAKTRPDSIKFPRDAVRVYGNTGLVSGILETTTTVDGKSTTGRLMVLFVWVKNGGNWQMVARQATRPAP